MKTRLTGCDRAAVGLSALQRDILCCVLESTVSMERRVAAIADDGRRNYHQLRVEEVGVSWSAITHERTEEYPGASRLGISTSLRRLEARGLIVRCNERSGDGQGYVRCRLDQPPPKRTTSVKLTDAGRHVAQLLTTGITHNVSHCEGEEES